MLIPATMKDVIKARVAGTSSMYLVGPMGHVIAESFVVRVEMPNTIIIRPDDTPEGFELQVKLNQLRVSV